MAHLGLQQGPHSPSLSYLVFISFLALGRSVEGEGTQQGLIVSTNEKVGVPKEVSTENHKEMMIENPEEMMIENHKEMMAGDNKDGVVGDKKEVSQDTIIGVEGYQKMDLEDQKKIVEDQKMLVEDQKKIVGYQKKIMGDQKKNVGYQKMFVGDQKKIVKDQKNVVEVMFENQQKEHLDLIRPTKDLSIWIEEDQVKFFSGIRHLVIHVVANGIVMPYLLDRNLETHLPVIPPEVEEVRFRWRAGNRKYKYNFYRLESHDQHLLMRPSLDIPTRGRIPSKPGAFSVRLPCTGNITGIASFSIGLEILSRKKRLAGTPLKLRLRKECLLLGPNPSCDRKCHSHGHCDSDGGCICRQGWEGDLCQIPVCDPQCMNGGTCSSPGVCDCPAGFKGHSCEGGICEEPCRNRGKCIQKDTCSCKSGYYGSRCEFSKCVVPCLNGGQCRGVNRCRCKAGYSGNHCQVLPHDKRVGRDHTDWKPCMQEDCRMFKRCRKQHCSLINKLDKSQLRACKLAYCGAVLSCDSSSCGRVANRDRDRRRRRHKRKKLL